ncbi:MAG: thiamine diphosphokinase [Clostridiales bacterium]|nr:thiamine diphosphokinase [Clostridiales bacterium]
MATEDKLNSGGICPRLCVIVGAGPVSAPPAIPKDAFIIAADGGLGLLRELEVSPHLTVGDFDSLGYIPSAGEVIRRPVMKNETDTMLAIGEGLRRGCREFVIYGGLGGRLDHTLANLQTLAWAASRGVRATLADGELRITAIRNGSLFIPAERQSPENRIVSVFAHGGRAEGVTIRGLLYEIEKITLSPDCPLGVSNEYLPGKDAFISAERGTLIIYRHEISGSQADAI